MERAYDDGVAQLYVGDCATLLPQLKLQANLILTSPPYDRLRDYGGDGFIFEPVADACVDSLAPGGVLVWIVADATIDGTETCTSMKQALYFREKGLLLHDTMIYVKRGGPAAGTQKRHKNAWEYMYVFSNGQPKTVNLIEDKIVQYPGANRLVPRRQKDGSLEYGSRGEMPEVTFRDNVWSYSPGFRKSARNVIAHKHPAIFPEELAGDHIRTWTEPNDLVLDPMVGSGTTMRAAKDLNRRSVGIEKHEGYIEDIKMRMAQQTLWMPEIHTQTSAEFQNEFQLGV